MGRLESRVIHQILSFKNSHGNSQKWKSVDTVMEYLGKFREYDRIKKNLLRKAVSESMVSLFILQVLKKSRMAQRIKTNMWSSMRMLTTVKVK